MGKFKFKAVRVDAVLSCPMCSGGKTTFVASDSIILKVVTSGLAHNNDTNIVPFSLPQCATTRTACAPVLDSAWKFVAINAKLNEKPFLLEKSIIRCNAGHGILRVTNTGQTILKIDLANVIVNAVKRLKEMIESRLNNEEEFNKYFDKWFGDVHSDAERQAMRDRMIRMDGLLDKMLNGDGTLNEDYFDFNNEDRRYNVFAYVHPNDSNHVVTICPETFSESNSTVFDTPAGVLGHECSHFTDIGGTEDFAYGQSDCLKLVNDEDPNTLNNADSFEYFLEDTTP